MSSDRPDARRCRDPKRARELGNIEKIERYGLCARDDLVPAARPDECPHMMATRDELCRQRRPIYPVAPVIATLVGRWRP